MENKYHCGNLIKLFFNGSVLMSLRGRSATNKHNAEMRLRIQDWETKQRLNGDEAENMRLRHENRGWRIATTSCTILECTTYSGQGSRFDGYSALLTTQARVHY